MAVEDAKSFAVMHPHANDDRVNDSSHLRSHSPLLNLEYSDKRGRHYVANQDIRSGTLLLVDEPIRSPPYDRREIRPPEWVINALTYQILETGNCNELHYYTEHVDHNLKSPHEEFDDHTWQLAVARVRTNSFDTETKGQTMKRILVNPYTSYFNHSCWPTAAAFPTHEDVVYVFTIQDVKKGEEVFIDYRTSILLLPTHRRRSKVADVWGFHCDCPRCELGNPNDVHLMASTPELESEMERVYSELRDLGGGENFLQRCIEFVTRPDTPFAHWAKQDLRNQLLPVLINNAYSAAELNMGVDILKDQLRSAQLVAPVLHHYKLALIRTFIEVSVAILKREMNDVMEELRTLEPLCDTILDLYPVSIPQRTAVAVILRDRGLEFLKQRTNWALAADMFDQSLTCIPAPKRDVVEEKQLGEIRLQCRLGRSECNLHLGRYESVIKDCNFVLQFEKKNGLALKIRGLAYHHLGEHQKGFQDLTKAAPLLPEQAQEIKELLAMVKGAMKVAAKKA